MLLSRLFPTLTLLMLALGVAAGAQAAADRGIIIEPGDRGQSNRLALVIGNDYDGESGHLQNPTHDADDMRKTLSQLGFTVMGDNQQSLEEMNALVREFGDRLRPGMVGLFYFAGHGMQINGQNYLIPEQSAIQREDEVPFRALAVDQVLAKMAKNKTGLNLLMLDACRDNPFARSFRSNATGLAKMEAPSGTLISYAAKPGTRSKDGNGRNGLYTSVLLKYLPIPGMPIEQMLNKVGSDVRRLSNEEQLTWKEGLLDSADGADFCFAGCGGGGPTPTTPPYRPVTPPPAPAPRPIPQRQTVTPRPAPVTPAVTPPPRPAPPAAACDDCPELVRLPGGSFMMGSTAAETGSDQDERPRHSVTVKSFALGKYEVTRAQYTAFVEATGYSGGSSCFTYDVDTGKWVNRAGRDWRSPGYSQGGNHPVVCVSLEDAEAYARWLSGQTGRRYRLPTEAEWEYAARGGTDTVRYWGDDPKRACEYANVSDRTAAKKLDLQETADNIHFCTDGAVNTATVGSYRANPFGLFDMLGNVREWTCSAYTEGGYDGHENTCTNDASSRRVNRGGSWGNKPDSVRSANRLRDGPTYRDSLLGFRLAQD